MKEVTIQALADELKDFLIEYEYDNDVRIYFLNKAYEFLGHGKFKVLEDVKASEYFDYANDDTLSMSFEGSLYDLLSDPSGRLNLLEEFDNIFDKYGVYYERGNAWNLAVYK